MSLRMVRGKMVDPFVVGPGVSLGYVSDGEYMTLPSSLSCFLVRGEEFALP